MDVDARFGAGHGHAFAGAHADQVRLELRECGEDIEEHLPHGVARIIERRAERRIDAPRLRALMGIFHDPHAQMVRAAVMARFRDGSGQCKA